MNMLLCLALFSFVATDEVSFYEAEQIFPPVEPQTHAPGIVETAKLHSGEWPEVLGQKGVPEEGLEPSRPCGHWILSLRPGLYRPRPY